MSGAEVARVEAALKREQAQQSAQEAYLKQAHVEWWQRQAECFRMQARLLAHASVPLGSQLAMAHELKALTLALFQSAAEYSVPLEQIHEQGAKVYAQTRANIETEERLSKEAEEIPQATEKPEITQEKNTPDPAQAL